MVSRHSTPIWWIFVVFFQPPLSNSKYFWKELPQVLFVLRAQGTFLAPCPVPQGAPTNSHPDLQGTPPVKDKDTTNTYFETTFTVCWKMLIFKKGIPNPNKNSPTLPHTNITMETWPTWRCISLYFLFDMVEGSIAMAMLVYQRASPKFQQCNIFFGYFWDSIWGLHV